MLSYVKTHESLLLEHVYFGGHWTLKWISTWCWTQTSKHWNYMSALLHLELSADTWSTSTGTFILHVWAIEIQTGSLAMVRLDLPTLGFRDCLLTYKLSYLLTVVIHLLANLFNCSLIVFMSFVNVRMSEKNILVVRRWHLMNLWHITQMVTLSSLLINTDTCWMVNFIAGNTIQRTHWHTD